MNEHRVKIDGGKYELRKESWSWCTTCKLAKPIAPGYLTRNPGANVVAHVDLYRRPCTDHAPGGAPYHETDEEERLLNFEDLMAEVGDWPFV